jgi:hypothetical protein
LKLLNILLLAIVIASCKQSREIPQDFDYGKVENNVYKNGYFNFELQIPENWVVQSKEQQEKVKNAGREIISKNDKSINEKIKAEEITTATLLMVFKFPIDSVAGEFNSSFMMQAQNIKGVRGVENGEDVLDEIKKELLRVNSGFKIAPDYSKEKIGSHDFYVMKVLNTYGGIEDITQMFYVTIDRGFALSAILSYVGEEQGTVVKSMLHNIKFH